MNIAANINTPKEGSPGHLMIGIVNIDNKPDVRMTEAVEEACMSLSRYGWNITQRKAFGSSDLEDSRNQIGAEFYANRQFTQALLVDGDVSWEPGTVERLLMHPVDFVLGAYPKRSDGEGYPIRKLPGPVECVNPITGEPHPYGIAKIAAGPAGLLRISRASIDRLVEANADSWYGQPKVTGKKAWQLFEFTVEDHERYSEDMNFCRKWRAIGGEVWCDPHLTLHHHGDKTYSGRFADHLKELGLMAGAGKVEPIR